jgi:GT2 family glycosyltransferase
MDERKKIKLVVGFITYGDTTFKYLPYFLESLSSQSFKDFIIIAADNTEVKDNKNKEYIASNYPGIDLEWSGENKGFARAYNVLIRKTITMGAEYFLTLNPDMILRPDALARMVKIMDRKPNLGSLSPKVMRWDFEKNIKTKLIDTCGIILNKGLRFSDLGQAMPDNSQYDNSRILGPSGCASFFRISALEKVSYHLSDRVEYYDELMFMYKEDCDIAYRLHLSGYGSELASDAVIFHDRTAEAQGESDTAVALNRRNKSKSVKSWSFLNQQIIFSKYWKLQNFKNKLSILSYQLKMIGYIILFEQYLLKEFKVLRKLKPEINEKRKLEYARAKR